MSMISAFFFTLSYTHVKLCSSIDDNFLGSNNITHILPGVPIYIYIYIILSIQIASSNKLPPTPSI